MRVRIDEWGVKGAGLVVCYHEPERKRFTVEVYRNGRPKRESVAYRKGGLTMTQARATARAMGQAAHAARAAQTSSATAVARMDDLYRKYVTAMESAWRPATQTGNAYRWRLWEAFIKPQTDPETITEDTLDDFVKAMRGKRAINQTRMTVQLVRAVYRLALRRKWVTNAAPITYEFRTGKDEAKLKPEEYHPDEWRKLLAVTAANVPSQWRLRAVLLIQGGQAMRINTILHLTAADFDLEAGVIRWPAQWMKQGKEFVQPLTAAGREGIELALAWRAADRYEGPWLFYSLGHGGRSKAGGVVSYQSIHSALLAAEQRAGVTHKKYRATHGTRRMSATNVYNATGDLMAAAAWLSDSDVKQMKSYIKRDDERLEKGLAASNAASESA